MTEEKLDFLCKGCGQVFSAFLREIAEHNGKITCPGCGRSFQADLGRDGVISPPSGKLQS